MAGGSVGQYRMEDDLNFRSQGLAYGGFLDIMSTVKLSPTYSQPTKTGGSVSLSIPMTLDYGIEGGFETLNNAFNIYSGFQSGSITQIYGRFHLDLFRMFGVGAGPYHVDLPDLWPQHSAETLPKQTPPGWGWIYGGQLILFPFSQVRPFIDVRWTTDPMPGRIMSIGLKIELDRHGM